MPLVVALLVTVRLEPVAATIMVWLKAIWSKLVAVLVVSGRFGVTTRHSLASVPPRVCICGNVEGSPRTPPTPPELLVW